MVSLALAVSGCQGAAAGRVTPPTTGPLPATSTTHGQPASTTTTVSTTTTTTTVPAHVAQGPTVSIALVGDVMLGRGLSSIVRNEPLGLFEDVRHILTEVDIAAANLESPLTLRPHIATNPFALEADPAAAESLALAGFDVGRYRQQSRR